MVKITEVYLNGIRERWKSGNIVALVVFEYAKAVASVEQVVLFDLTYGSVTVAFDGVKTNAG